MKAKILTLVLCLLVFTSTISQIDAQQNFNDIDQNSKINNLSIDVKTNLENKNPLNHAITLTDDLSTIDNSGKQSDEKATHYRIQLHDQMDLITNDYDVNEIIFVKHDSDKKAMMERIFDRTKLNRIVFDSTIYSTEDDLTLASLANEAQSETSYNNLELAIDQRLPTLLIDFSISEKQLDTLYENVDEITDQIIITTTSLFDVNSPMFLLVLPFAGFVLIRVENKKLDFNSLKRVFCFVFVTILISSAVITPLSISSAYWGVAYAEELTDVQPTSEDESTIDSSNSTETKSQGVEKAAEAQAEATKPVDDIIVTNFQSLGGSVTIESVEPVNATSIEPVVEEVIEPVEPVDVNATSVEPVNATTTELVNATSVEPVVEEVIEPVEPVDVIAWFNGFLFSKLVFTSIDKLLILEFW